MADIPGWAIERAFERAKEHGHVGVPCGAIDAFARYIAAHEEPPVDPLLIEAREIAVRVLNQHPNPSPITASEIRSGSWDRQPVVQAPFAALRRGMELAREQS